MKPLFIGRDYTLQTSRDLMSWNNVQTLTASAATKQMSQVLRGKAASVFSRPPVEALKRNPIANSLWGLTGFPSIEDRKEFLKTTSTTNQRKKAKENQTMKIKSLIATGLALAGLAALDLARADAVVDWNIITGQTIPFATRPG